MKAAKQTYFAIYRNGNPLPVALFASEEHADEWQCNPGLFSTCRRQLVFGASPIFVTGEQPIDLLRAIVLGDDSEMFSAIEAAKKLLTPDASTL